MCFRFFASFIALSLGLDALASGFHDESERSDASQWQGVSLSSATGTRSPPEPGPLSEPASRFLLLDTGGSGGMFGKGDSRSNLLDVYFWGPDIGWASGDSGAFRTQNGGLSWERMKLKSERGSRWQHVAMSGPRQVWLLKRVSGKHPSQLWYSADDGENWKEMAKNTFKDSSDLYVQGEHLWVLCGNYPSYHSDDAGKSWRRIAFGGGLLHGANKIAVPADVRSGDGFVAYVLGQRDRHPRLVKSVDGGRRWNLVPLPEPLPPEHWRYRIFFATSRLGMIGLPNGQILVTSDGGESWQRRDLPTDQAVTALWLDQLGRGFAAVENRDVKHLRDALFETGDMGRTWKPVLSGKLHVNELYGLGPGRLWAVGDVPGHAANDLVAILEAED